MSQDSLGPLPSVVENGAFPADTAAGAHPSSSPFPTQLVPNMQRSFHALMHAIFEPNTGATGLSLTPLARTSYFNALPPTCR